MDPYQAPRVSDNPTSAKSDRKEIARHTGKYLLLIAGLEIVFLFLGIPSIKVTIFMGVMGLFLTFSPSYISIVIMRWIGWWILIVNVPYAYLGGSILDLVSALTFSLGVLIFLFLRKKGALFMIANVLSALFILTRLFSMVLVTFWANDGLP